jgi:hypothetical protein
MNYNYNYVPVPGVPPVAPLVAPAVPPVSIPAASVPLVAPGYGTYDYNYNSYHQAPYTNYSSQNPSKPSIQIQLKTSTLGNQIDVDDNVILFYKDDSMSVEERRAKVEAT